MFSEPGNENLDFNCFSEDIYEFLSEYQHLDINLQVVILVTGEKGNFGEYPLVAYYTKNNSCLPELLRHPYAMRFNSEAETYYNVDPTVTESIGIHRFKNLYTIAIPIVYKNLYFSDLYFHVEISNSRCN